MQSAAPAAAQAEAVHRSAAPPSGRRQPRQSPRALGKNRIIYSSAVLWIRMHRRCQAPITQRRVSREPCRKLEWFQPGTRRSQRAARAAGESNLRRRPGGPTAPGWWSPPSAPSGWLPPPEPPRGLRIPRQNVCRFPDTMFADSQTQCLRTPRYNICRFPDTMFAVHYKLSATLQLTVGLSCQRCRQAAAQSLSGTVEL